MRARNFSLTLQRLISLRTPVALQPTLARRVYHQVVVEDKVVNEGKPSEDTQSTGDNKGIQQPVFNVLNGEELRLEEVIEEEEGEKVKNGGVEMWDITRRINDVLDTRPKVFMLSFLGLRAGTMGVLTYSLLGVNWFTGPAFVISWMIARVTSKFRQPLNLAMAHGLNRLCPQLALLKFSNMFLVNVDKRIDEIYNAQIDANAPFGSKVLRLRRSRKPRLQDSKRRYQARQRLADASKMQRIEWEKMSIVEKRVEQVYNEAFNADMKRRMAKGEMPEQKKLAALKDKLKMDKVAAVQKIVRSRRIRDLIGRPMNNYGFSWYICSKVSTVATIVGCTIAIHRGVDLMWLIDTKDTLSKTTAAMGGAFLINTVLVPLHFVNAWHLTRFIDSQWPKVHSEIRPDKKIL